MPIKTQIIPALGIDEKTNEIPMVKPLLQDLDIKGAVVTLDAMHTQRETARFLVEDKKADYVMTVKGNQPALKKAIESLDSEDYSPEYMTVDKGHGRIETRTIKTSNELNQYLDFPHVGQVAQLTRDTTDLKGQFLRRETVFIITSLDSVKASPELLLSLNRNHWSIENRLHYVRDVTFDEDRSRVRKGRGFHMMASLRNLAITLLRIAGFKNIAQGLRYCSRYVTRPLRLLGLMTT